MKIITTLAKIGMVNGLVTLIGGGTLFGMFMLGRNVGYTEGCADTKFTTTRDIMEKLDEISDKLDK